MSHHRYQQRQDATARQLDLRYGDVLDQTASEQPSTGRGPVPLCVVCGRQPARFPLPTAIVSSVRPVHPKLCLRCNHAVLRQRRMVQASLIVPRHSNLSSEDKYAQLDHRRRRAQVAARHSLDLS